MSVGPRGQRDEHKQGKRDAIVKAARALFERSPRMDATVAEVAERAGVAKGTVFLYFTSREAIELAVLEGELRDWLVGLDGDLEQGGAWTIERASATLVGSVVLRKLMLRLLARLESAIEHRVPEESSHALARWMAERFTATGARLEARLPTQLSRGEGARFLLRFRALATGLWVMSDRGASVTRALTEPALSSARVDFERELDGALSALLRGMIPR
jgi:AcrR family transcriptional regulator